jgi:hypothetical protein
MKKRKRKQRKEIIKLLRAIDDKLAEIINGQARLEAQLEQSGRLEEVPSEGGQSAHQLAA